MRVAWQVQYVSNSAAQLGPHPRLYRPKHMCAVEEPSVKDHHPVHIHFRAEDPHACCDGLAIAATACNKASKHGRRVRGRLALPQAAPLEQKVHAYVHCSL